MFEQQKAQRAGMTSRERMRMTVLVVGLLMVGAAMVYLRSCRVSRPGGRELPEVGKVEGAAPARRHVDKERLKENLGDEAASQRAFVPAALQQVETELTQGVSDVPRPMGASALAQLPVDEALGGLFEVSGKVTALVDSQYRGERERLWSLVLQDGDGAQVVAVKPGRVTEPLQGTPTDAWRLAPTEIRVDDQVIVRGAYVQRRTGTIGSIALGEPTPVLYATAFRRLEQPPAIPIDEPSEASWDQIDDIRPFESARLDDPALYQMIQWARKQGQPWFRAQIGEKGDAVELWGKEAFDVWSEEINKGNKTPPEPRPFTIASRGKMFRTRGVIGKVLREDWDAVRPNIWGVNGYEYLYLWSDYYGNRVLPCLSPFPFEAYGLPPDWKGLRDRVEVFGYFIKTYTFDTQYADESGTAHQKLSMPLFLVVDVRVLPIYRDTTTAPIVAWVVGGMVVLLATVFLLQMRRDRKDDARYRRERTERALKRTGGVLRPPASSPTPPSDGEPPA